MSNFESKNIGNNKLTVKFELKKAFNKRKIQT